MVTSPLSADWPEAAQPLTASAAMPIMPMPASAVLLMVFLSSLIGVGFRVLRMGSLEPRVGHALDDVALGEQVQREHREDAHHRTGHDDVPLRRELSLEAGECDGEGLELGCPQDHERP